MKEKILAASLGVLALMLCPACGESERFPGDVTFIWSFSGLSCAEDSRIESVRIAIPGEALDNGGVYPCTVNGVDGIILNDFAPGTYSFAIDAVDYDGTVSYTGSGGFVVDGDTLVQVDLFPAG
jgi:hypothetical protein